jgi:uncharacterized repeat protein (TIGR01451 family)
MANGDERWIEIPVSVDEPMDINNTVTVWSVGEAPNPIPTTDPNQDNNQAGDGVQFLGLADLAVAKFAFGSPDGDNPCDTPNPTEAIAGLQLCYLVQVTNLGLAPSPAINVVMTDVLPAGLEILEVQPDPADNETDPDAVCEDGVPGDASQPTTCYYDTIDPGETKSVGIRTMVLAEATGVLDNTACATSDTADTNNINDCGNVDVPVEGGDSLLTIEKTDLPDPVVPGELLEYTLTVTNVGPSTATDVTVVDTLPPSDEVIFQSYNIPLPSVGSCDVGVAVPVVLTCTSNLDLDPGDTFVVTIEVQVDPSFDGADVFNTATVTWSTLDHEVCDNGVGDGTCSATADQTTTVSDPQADQWIDKTGNFPTGNPSTTVIWFLTVHNDPGCANDDGGGDPGGAAVICGDGGPSDAQNVVVFDYLPGPFKKEDIVFMSVGCEDDSTASDHIVRCEAGNIPYGASFNFEIHAQYKGGIKETPENEACIDVPLTETDDPDETNNCDTFRFITEGGSDRPGGPGGGRGRGGETPSRRPPAGPSGPGLGSI